MAKLLKELNSNTLRDGMTNQLRIHIRMHTFATGSKEYIVTPPVIETVDVGRGMCVCERERHCNTSQHTATHCNTLQHTGDPPGH